MMRKGLPAYICCASHKLSLPKLTVCLALSIWLAAYALMQGADINRQPSHQIPVSAAIVVNTYPHDPHAFTQGLEYYGGYLYESTGIAGQSTLREVALETGKVLRKVALPERYFGEGPTIFNGKIYQLTWTSKTGFIYDRRTFRQIGEFHYDFEGWGLTHDETMLIASDGTNKIRYLDPNSFTVSKTLEIYAGGEAVVNLN